MEIEFKPLSADHLDQIKNFTDRWIGVGYFSENELDEAIRKGQKEDLNAGKGDYYSCKLVFGLPLSFRIFISVPSFISGLAVAVGIPM